MARKYDLIALDLDRTTLHSDSSLDPETREALEAAIQSGMEVVVASGRAVTALPPEIMEISGIRYAITTNGTEVNRLSDGAKVKTYTLPEEAVRFTEAIVAPHREKAGMEVFMDGVPYTGKAHWEDPRRFGCSEAYVPYIQQTRKKVEDIHAFVLEHSAEIDSINIACPDPELREELRKQLREKVKGVKLTSSVTHLTEMINEEAGKASGLRFVCEMLGIHQERTVAAGDADNDIDMIRWAGLGVAVANASPNCLAAADRIIGSNDDNSVAKLIREIID